MGDIGIPKLVKIKYAAVATTHTAKPILNAGSVTILAILVLLILISLNVK